MKHGALLLSLLVACGSSAPKPAATSSETADPIRKTGAPSCQAVVEHLATLGDRDPTQGAKPDPALRAHCETDAWTEDQRSCLATAQSDAEVDGCKGTMSAAQKSAFAAPPVAPAAAAAPPPAGGGATESMSTKSHSTRAPVKKGSSKTSDPDEGGQ